MVAIIQAPPKPALERRVADVLVDTLVQAGVTTFFGVPGGAISSVYDALGARDDVRLINARHETGAVFAAMGFERTGGGLPCVLMTSGPGITNAITGIAAAHADGVPMIIIGGEVPRKNFGRGALQEGSRYHLDTLGMLRSVTKSAVEATTARGAATTLQKAIATALSGRRGPVYMSLPLDVANDRVLPSTTSSKVSTFFEWDDSTLDAAASALSTAERGMILVGSGCRGTEAPAIVAALASALRMPVATTPKAKGLFPESDPLSLGIFGHGGHNTANAYLKDGIDTLLVVGSSLGETGTNSWSNSLRPSKHLVQIDIDAAQIGKNYQVDIGLVGPAQVILQKILPRIRRRPRALFVPPQVEHFVEHAQRDEEVLPLRPPRVLKLLQEIVSDDAIFTTDIGEHMLFALHHLTIDLADGFVVNSGFGSMGSGIGAAVGAKLAHPGRPVVAVCGDFGFQMYGCELATCVQDKIGVVFAIFNDARMRMVENGMSQHFGRTPRLSAPRMNFAEVARASGAHGFVIRTPEDLRAIPKSVLNGARPVVLDIEIDPTAAFAANARVSELTNFMNLDD